MDWVEPGYTKESLFLAEWANYSSPIRRSKWNAIPPFLTKK